MKLKPNPIIEEIVILWFGAFGFAVAFLIVWLLLKGLSE